MFARSLWNPQPAQGISTRPFVDINDRHNMSTFRDAKPRVCCSVALLLRLSHLSTGLYKEIKLAISTGRVRARHSLEELPGPSPLVLRNEPAARL